MYFCETCGQCVYISEDSFYGVYYTSGWEKCTVEPEGGDIIDYIDSETTDSEFNNSECPYCSGEDINTDWDGDEEEAFDRRNIYTEQQNQQRREYDKHLKEQEQKAKANDPKRKWDVEQNV